MDENQDTLYDPRNELSESWKKCFRLLDLIGADKRSVYSSISSSEYKALKYSERRKISFNILAFLFGPFYYLSKGIWLKASFLFSAGILLNTALTVIENIIGVALPNAVYWIPIAAISAQLANFDYYRLVTKDEQMWVSMPSIFSSPLTAIVTPVIAVVILFTAVSYSPIYLGVAPEARLSDVSGIWRADSDGSIVNIDLDTRSKTITVQGTSMPVTVSDVDNDNDVITLAVSTSNDSRAIWALRQLWDKNGQSFTLLLTLQNGAQEGLSYIRNN